MNIFNDTFQISQRVYLAWIVTLSSIFAIACDDPPPPVRENIVDQAMDSPDMMRAVTPDMERSDDLSPPDLDLPPPDLSPPPPPPPGWIELTLNPARTFYKLSDTPSLSVSGFDLYGDPIIGGSYLYRFSAPQVRLTDSSGSDVLPNIPTESTEVTLEMISEGELLIEVCAVDLSGQEPSREVCATRPLIIDQSAPDIKVFWPPRGANLSAQDPWPEWGEVVEEIPAPAELFGGVLSEPPASLNEWIPVYGQVREDGGVVSLALNGTPIEVDAEGRFSGLVPARSGYVEISLVGDDSVRTTQSVNRRWVLYALDYLPLEERSNNIEDGLILGLNQQLIDDNTPLENQRPLDLREAAQLVELILTEVNPSSLIESGSLINTSQLSLSLGEVELGAPEVDLRVTQDGLSMFIALEEVTVSVTGSLDLGGSPINLSGDLEVQLGAFADYQLTTSATSAFSLSYLNGAVALNQLTPRLSSEAANALLEVLESTARQLVVDQLELQLISALRDELPSLLEAAVDDIFDTLRSVTVQLDSGLEGAPILDLVFSLTPQSVEMIPSTSAQLSADWRSTRSATTREDVEVEVRGVPSLYERREPLFYNDGFSLMLHTDVVNSILTEITRGGLLSLAPQIPASAQFFYSAAQLTSLSPPVLVQGEESERYPIYLELGALSLGLTQSSSGETDVYEVFIRVGGEVVTDQGTFSLTLAETPEVTVTLSALNNPQPAVGEVIIENLLIQQVWPLVSEGFASQLIFGFPDSAIPLDQLGSLGVEIGQSDLRVRFAESARYSLGWIHLGGYISILIE